MIEVHETIEASTDALTINTEDFNSMRNMNRYTLALVLLMLATRVAISQVRPVGTATTSPGDLERRLPVSMAPAGLRQLTSDENDERDASFSPRGDIFAVSSNRSGTFELWLYPSRQGGVRQLTMNPVGVQDVSPDWHPTSNNLLFQSNRIGGIPNVWRYNFGERGLTQLTFTKFGAENPRYSPDGSQLIYTAFDEKGKRHIWMVDAEGRNPTELIDGFDASWAPDGRTIVFARSVREGSDRTTDIWLMDADGTNARRLTGEKAKSETAPRFSPDGQNIVYEMTWSPLDSTAAQASRRILREVWMVGADGLNARQLTLFEASRPNWTPDSKQIVLSSARGASQDVWMAQALVSNAVSRP